MIGGISDKQSALKMSIIDRPLPIALFYYQSFAAKRHKVTESTRLFRRSQGPDRQRLQRLHKLPADLGEVG